MYLYIVGSYWGDPRISLLGDQETQRTAATLRVETVPMVTESRGRSNATTVVGAVTTSSPFWDWSRRK